jgi:putative ABC transport system permease protein
MLGLSFRMTWRDWRAGELRFLMLALIVAVASLASVGFFVDRMRAGLQRDAHQMLGGDLVINSDQPIPPAWKEQAQALGLQSAETLAFPSMAISLQGTARLVSLKAVSTGYPLRGQVKLRHGKQEQATTLIPASGTVWLDQAVLNVLGVQVGDQIKLGESTFSIAQVIASEPDRGTSLMNLAPRVMLNMQDMPATQLNQNGSRISYRLLLAGSDTRIAAFQTWVQAEIARAQIKGVRLESLESGRPEMKTTLDRAEKFLALVALLSAMLAALAIAMAARRFMLRHLDACAMLRCLGLTQRQVTWLFFIEFLLLGVIASLLGVALGFAAHYALLQALGNLVSHDLPPPGILPAAQAALTGLFLLLGFALPPILQLRNVPHNRVIRREQDAPKAMPVLTYALGLSVFVALLIWQTRDVKLGLLVAGAFLAGLAGFALVAWLAVRALQPLRGLFRHASWRFALTALQRRPAATITQVVALSLGLFALLLLTVIRADLVAAWKQATPADAPNQFVINIQPDQKEDITRRLRQVTTPVLYPMIRGRLIAVNQQTIGRDTYREDRARGLIEREFNLSTMRELQAGNTISAGRWYQDKQPEASVEEGIAKTLHLKLGDVLTFDVAGQQVQATITSLRKLEWGSMRVNFFVIINPTAMAQMPQTWITSFYLPPQQADFVNGLTRDFPNLTVFDVGAIIRQVQDVVDQVVAAVEFLFLFTLISGLLVLYAALLASQDVRMKETALLRALGASRKQLSQAQWIEFLLLGSLAGLLAATAASAMGWTLAHTVFEFEWNFEPLVWLLGTGAGAVCALAGAWLGLRNILRQAPLQSLREI